MKMLNVTIDGIKTTVPEGTTVMEAAAALGVDIPALCYLKDINEVGACRICVVEVKGARALQASCVLPVSEGMEVQTESAGVAEARKEILRLMLANHPNDCLTCDKAGECKLQEYAYRYDVKFVEHNGKRKNYDVDKTNPYIYRDNNKCILCGRCVNTCAKVPDRAVLAFGRRGFNTTVIADNDKAMGESGCVSCARCISVCPVGALLDTRAMNTARSWELEKEAVKCAVCEYGCDFQLLKKNGKVVAVRALASGEGRPLCLKGRLTVDLTCNDSPKTPYIKKDGKFVEATWSQVLGLEKLLEKL